MKTVNLKALSTAYAILPESSFNDLCSYYEIAPKTKELTSVDTMVKDFDSLCKHNQTLLFKLLDRCYFGYSIPHISKEIDCLWVSETSIIDIELKSQPVPDEKMKKQLERNRYYLKALGREVFTFTYESKEHKCYQLEEDGDFHSVKLNLIAKCLYNQVNNETRIDGSDIDSLFDPCDYLVSPFNSTEKFLSGEYFLTGLQEDYKKAILDSISSESGAQFYAINGPAGSGKTLLVYDIAKELKNRGKDVLIIHSGNLNEGQNKLRAAGWKIGPSKDYCSLDWDKGDYAFNNEDATIIVIDEAQRSYHLPIISEGVQDLGLKCLIAYDPVQYLSKGEAKYEIEKKVEELIYPNKPFVLSSCIRTNSNIKYFIDRLFDKSKNGKVNKEYVDICFCSSSSEVNSVLSQLNSLNYTALSFTPSMPSYKAFKYEEWFPDGLLCAHEVVGQEFDSVACVIGPDIRYDKQGHLESAADYRYDENKMLYQVMSRARKKLFVIIYKNLEMLNRCLEILS